MSGLPGQAEFDEIFHGTDALWKLLESVPADVQVAETRHARGAGRKRAETIVAEIEEVAQALSSPRASGSADNSGVVTRIYWLG